MIKNFHCFHILIFLVISSMVMAGDKEKLNETLKKYNELSQSFKTSSISVPALMKIIKDKNTILIDVRKKKESSVSTLPHSISQDEFLSDPTKYKNKKLVAYCTIGFRSGKFCEKYQKWNILNLEGGVLAWSHFKGEFYKNGKETKEVHTYSKDWNFLHSDYKAIFK